MNLQLSLFDQHPNISETNQSDETIVNVASVPMRSPFRYAGGKTWLIPRIRQWLRHRASAETELIELFTGGGIVSLTAVFENLVKCATMVELDEGVAAVWQTITGGDAEWLADKIMHFELTSDSAKEAIANANQSLRDLAFATVVKNRVNRGGILADGASFVKHGENGKGILSRWYPATLKRRILEIHHVRERLHFLYGDAFDVCEVNKQRDDVVYFIDPPYVKAGGRLYRHSEIDHAALFAHASRLMGDFLMTYDNNIEIRQLAKEFDFDTRPVSMKNTHHAKQTELLISKNLEWFDG